MCSMLAGGAWEDTCGVCSWNHPCDFARHASCYGNIMFSEVVVLHAALLNRRFVAERSTVLEAACSGLLLPYPEFCFPCATRQTQKPLTLLCSCSKALSRFHQRRTLKTGRARGAERDLSVGGALAASDEYPQRHKTRTTKTKKKESMIFNIQQILLCVLA